MGYIFCSRITFHFTFTSCLVSTSNFKIGNAKGFTQNFIYRVFTFSLVVCIFTCDSCFIYKHCICALMPVTLMAGFFDIYSSRSDRYPAVLEWENHNMAWLITSCSWTAGCPCNEHIFWAVIFPSWKNPRRETNSVGRRRYWCSAGVTWTWMMSEQYWKCDWSGE